MYLKKIEVLGFKSFADKTEIAFERGVTCIVGPNGCGKSNISDSIRWVLGERSAKLLRGSKMEDIIFSGTDLRKPLNLAEVSLTIDNTDHKLPIGYEEVVITRRLHRSGESEYLINKTPCRLKDIQDLILDTGIGSNSYSMIEQGRIDYILNAEVEERRFLIEEAAGISKYKVKKEEAIRKLERTEENLIRLNDIVSEVERNIRYAERQAERAERYKEQLERLKTLEIQKAFFELNVLNEQLGSLEREQGGHTASLNTLEEEASRQNSLLREFEERLQALEQAFFERESARSNVKEELTSIEARENFCREKIGFLKLSSEKTLCEIESLNKKRESIGLEIEHKNQERAQLLHAVEQLKSEHEQKKSYLTSHLNDVLPEDENLSSQRTLLFDLARQTSEIRNSLNRNHFELLSTERIQATLCDSKTKATETKKLLLEREGVSAHDRSAHQSRLTETRNALTSAISERERLEASLEAARDELTNLRAEKTKVESQILLLEELDHANGPDPKKIVAEHGSHPSQQGMMKVLLDLVEIEPGYELALEAALADSLKAVVTENMETAIYLFHQLKQSGSHRATIFIKDRAMLNGSLTKDPEAEAHPLVQKRLWDAVRVQKGYDGIFGNLLGKVFVIDEITRENASQLAKLAERVKLVSKSGAIFGPEFQITLRNGGFTPERSALARRKEMGHLQDVITQGQAKEKELTDSLYEFELKINSLRDREKMLNQELTACQGILERTEGTASAAREQMEQTLEELQVMDQETRQNDAEMERLKATSQKLAEELHGLEAQATRTQKELETLQEQIDSEKKTKEAIEHDLTHLDSKLEVQLEKEKDIEKAIDFLERQLNDLASQIDSLKQERQISTVQMDQLKIELEAFARRKLEANQSLIERSVEAEQVKRERSELTAKRSQALEKYQADLRALELNKQKSHEYNLKKMELNHQKNSITQDLHSRYKINVQDLNPSNFQLRAEDFQETKTDIERLREKMDSIGTVNLLAIEEYQELKGRYEFLLNQKRDLTEARDSLLEAIRKINRTTKKLFEETLVRVRESFREYYRILFGGGQADLILLDEENPIESGLDIVARPPGKKLQHISLLSGGEKALTAIALLLALFSVKPSPFCVLDEVDAPLDEANNDRFLSALKPFLGSTQFIIVTHSRKTIAMADALYGITMQEPGISKIVSVRLSSENATIEHTDSKLAGELNQVLN